MAANNNVLYSGYGLGVVADYLYYIKFGFLIKSPLRSGGGGCRYKFSLSLFFVSILPIYLARFFRLNVLNSVISGCEIYLWSKRRYWIYDVNESKFVAAGRFLQYKQPLNPLSLDSGGVLCGEYLTNPLMNAVVIYKLSREGFERVAEFSSGEINHVHSILKTNDINEYIVLCGDFQAAASIWKLSLNGVAPKLSVILHGEQKYRASVGGVYGDALIYATDTTTQFNKIMHLNLNAQILEDRAALPASVIYGCALNRGLLFSTNLEASIESKGYSIFKKWFSMELPRSFATDKVVLYGYFDGVLKILEEFIPKQMPYRLFQYPTCKFVQSDDYVVCNYISLRNYDCKFSVLRVADL